PFAEAFKSMWNHLMTIHRETGLTLEHINLGGGIPVNYLRDRSQADQLPEHERDMLGADLEPAAVLTEALRVARESAPDADAQYEVAGPLCDSGDVYFDIERHGRLPDYRLLPRDVKPGEVLALLNSGAYSLAQMFPYNGRPLPAAVLVRGDGKAELIRKRDSYEDLLVKDV